MAIINTCYDATDVKKIQVRIKHQGDNLLTAILKENVLLTKYENHINLHDLSIALADLYLT